MPSGRLPNFKSGRIGGLSYTDLNGAFKSNDLLRQQQDVIRIDSRFENTARWFGRITGVSSQGPYKYSVIEVVRTGNDWQPVPDGRVLDLENGFALNREEIDGVPEIAIGTVVELYESYDADAVRYWEFGAGGAGGVAGSQDVFVAVITNVSGTENATYGAQAILNPALTVGPNTFPINRAFALPVTYIPLQVGDVCLILRIFDKEGTEQAYLVAWEKVNVVTCDEEPPALAESSVRTASRAASLLAASSRYI